MATQEPKAPGGQAARGNLEPSEPARTYGPYLVLAAAIWFLVWVGRHLVDTILPTLNGDILYLFALVSELKAGVPLGNWILQPAPSFFPDGLIIFIISFVTRSANTGFFYYCVISCAALAVATYLCFRASLGNVRAILAATAGAAAVLALSTASPFFQNAFLPGHHGMALVMLLACIALSHHLLRRASLWSCFGLFALVALTFGSDRIFAIQGILPLGGCVVLGVLLRILPPSSLLHVVLPMALGTAVGHQLGRIPAMLGMFAPPTDAVFEVSVERMLGAIAILMPFFRQFPWLGPILGAFVFFGLAYVGGAAAPQVWPVLVRNRVRLSPASRDTWLTVATLCASLILNVAGVVFGGYMTDLYRLRYLDTLFVLPPLGLALLAASLRGPKLLALVPLGFGMYVAATFVREQPLKAKVDAYPSAIRCIDDVAKRNNIQFGYANYWQARRASLLSHQGLRLAHVTPDFRVHQWIGNLYWHQQAAMRPRALLVYMPNVNAASVRSVLGAPSEVFQCEGEVYVYREPPDARPSGAIQTKLLRPEVPLQW